MTTTTEVSDSLENELGLILNDDLNTFFGKVSPRPQWRQLARHSYCGYPQRSH